MPSDSAGVREPPAFCFCAKHRNNPELVEGFSFSGSGLWISSATSVIRIIGRQYRIHYLEFDTLIITLI